MIAVGLAQAANNAFNTLQSGMWTCHTSWLESTGVGANRNKVKVAGIMEGVSK